VFNDVKLAVHAGADVVVVDGMQRRNAATQTVFIENVGIPTLAALRQAVDALDDLNMRGTVQLVISGEFAAAPMSPRRLAMGADAVAIGQGVLVAPRLQQRHLHHGRQAPVRTRRTMPHSARRPASVTIAIRASARSGSRRRMQSRIAARSAVGAKRLRNYFENADMELDHHRARLRQAGRSSLGKGGLGGADGRVGCHGGGAARRDLVDSRAGGGAMIVELAQLTIVAGRGMAEFDSEFRRFPAPARWSTAAVHDHAPPPARESTRSRRAAPPPWQPTRPSVATKSSFQVMNVLLAAGARDGGQSMFSVFK